MIGDALWVDENRLASQFERLAQFSAAAAPAVTRVIFSDEDLAARAYLNQSFREAGLVVRHDAAGNLFARWPGQDQSLAAIGTGSHTDAIPNSGRYDGTVGVLGALEAIRALQQADCRPRRSIELLVFTAEEPTRFGIGCLGSRLLAGSLHPRRADSLQDQDGCTFHSARHRAGYCGLLEEVPLQDDYYQAFVELHIEQGPRLEQLGVPIGIVQAIAAPASLSVTFQGSGGHAGAVLMSQRNDSLVAAAELIVEVERAALGTGSDDTVATTGTVEVFPQAINSIPSRVSLGIDVRDIDLERRDQVLEQIRNHSHHIGRRRQQETSLVVQNADPPARCSRLVTGAIETACQRAQLPHVELISRAYHDSLFMARLAATGMIFIPCRGGISHRPDEYAAIEHIAAGVQVLALTLAALADS